MIENKILHTAPADWCLVLY